MGTSNSKSKTESSNATQSFTAKKLRRLSENDARLDPADFPVLSNWVVKMSALLCSASYHGAKFIDFVKNHDDHGDVKAVHLSAAEQAGKLSMVEARDDNGKQFIFVVFRSDMDLSTIISHIGVAGELNETKQSFDDRSVAIRPDFFLNKFQEGCTVVVTGHSVGGACATLLTEKIINSYLHLKIYKQLMCVTFGSPIIGDRFGARFMELNKEIYNHFVFENDIIPHVLCIDRTNHIFERTESFGPSGKIFLIKSKDSLQATCTLLDEHNRTQHYCNEFNRSQNSEELSKNHQIDNYMNMLKVANVINNVLPNDGAQVVEKHDIETIQISPSIALCTLIGLELEIRGSKLSVVEKVIVKGVEMVHISYHTNSCIIGRVSEQLALVLDTSENVVDIDLVTCFGEVIVLKSIGLRLVGNAKANVFPSALLASVLPLTALMIDGGTLTPDILETLEDIRKHVKGVESSIPIEFAFNMMTKNGREFEDSTLKVNDGPDNLVYLYMFLKRLSEVEIANWPQLCSTHMLRVLKDSIGNLETLMNHEQDGQIRRLLDDAFKPVAVSGQLYSNHWFQEAYSTLCREDFDSIFCTNQANSENDFWSFVVSCQVNVGFSFVHGSGNDVHGDNLHYYSTSWSNEKNASSMQIQVALDSLEKLNFETAKGFHITQRKFVIKTTNPSEASSGSSNVKQRIYHHFEFKYDLEPSKWLHSKAIIRSIAQTLIRAKELELHSAKQSTAASASTNASNNNNNHNATSLSIYHVQSFDQNFFLSSWFILNWFLSYSDHVSLDANEVEKTLKSLQDDIPITKVNTPAYEASLRLFHETITTTLEKQSSYVQNYFIRNNPRKKVLARLKRVRAEMLSNYYSVVPPFFSGLGVDFPVREVGSNSNPTKKGPNSVPFFNFIPRPLSVNATGSTDITIYDEANEPGKPLTMDDIVKRAEQASTGLQFMLLMLDKYEILTKEQLFQTKNDSVTKALRSAAMPITAIPKVLRGAYKVARYLTTGEFSHIIEASSGFRHLINSVYFSEQKVQSYNDFLDQLIVNLQLPLPSQHEGSNQEVQIAEKLDAIFKSIPPAVGEMSVKDLIRNSDQIFAHSPWYHLLDSRSKMLHIFMMKQIFHCYHIRSLRSKFIIVGINGEKNAGKTTLSSLLLGGDVVRGKRGLNMEDSTIFPTAYLDPVVLPKKSRQGSEVSQECEDLNIGDIHIEDPIYQKVWTKSSGSNTMIIDLPGCTDNLAFTIPTLFFPAVDISIFVISSRQSKQCDSSLSKFINAFVRVRKGPTLLCINGYDKHLESCVDFNSDYIEHATTFHAKPNALELCTSILEKEKQAWRQSATLQLPPINASNESFAWQCERRNPNTKNCVVYSAVPEHGYPLSIWMTSFLVDQVRYSFANDHLMNSSHVREWINESRDWYNTSAYRLNIVEVGE